MLLSPKRLARLLAVSAMLLVLAGCTSARPNPQPDTKRIAELENQLDGMSNLLGQPSIAVDSEPKNSVTAGDYVAWIKDVSVGSTSVVAAVDFLTDRHGHGNATNTLNRWHVIQRVPIRDEALIAVYAPDWGPLTIVTSGEFATRWKSQRELATTAYFVLISNGEAYALWPANYPRSLPEEDLN